MSTALRIEFTKPKGKRFPILSWLIRAIQDTEYSHVRFTWIRTLLDGSPQALVYEASGTHVRFVGTLAQKDHLVTVVKAYEITLTKLEYKKLVEMCMRYAYLRYGIKQLIGIGIAELFFLNRNPLAKGEYSQVCCELIARTMQEVKGWILSKKPDLDGPKELDAALTKLVQGGTIGIRRVI